MNSLVPGLNTWIVSQFSGKGEWKTNHFIMLLANLLAHELGHPLLLGVSVLGLDTGDYERHFTWWSRIGSCKKKS